MKKNKLYILSSILIIISLFATAVTCNLCGTPLDISLGDTETTEEEGSPASQREPTETTQSAQNTEAPVEGNNPPVIQEIEIMGIDVEAAEERGMFEDLPADLYMEEIPDNIFSIEAYDEDDNELQYRAYDSLGTNFDVTKIDNNNAEFIWDFPDLVGSYTLTMEVSDGKGGIDSQSVDMNFVEVSDDDGAVDFGEPVNNPPEITEGIKIENLPGCDSPDDGPYIEGGIHYKVSIEAHDPDGDPLTYEWYGGGEYGFSDNRANPTEWITPRLLGAPRFTVAIHVVVRDGNGGEDEDLLTDVVVE